MSGTLSICIASYRRPRGLFALLGGLDRLIFDVGLPEIRIVVADNDPAASAREIVDDARRWLRWPIEYTIEKRPGIPQARNAAIAAALPCDWIAFLDDDEVPDPRWLVELWRVREETGADVVTGPSLPRFDSEPPAWVREGGFFEPLRRASTSPMETAYTNNVLIRSAALLELGALFDERFAHGEDDELFSRMAAAGSKIVWADDALAFENIPPERATLRWILRRAHRVGLASARIERPRSGALRIAANALWCVLRGSAEGFVGALCGRAGQAARGLRLAVYGCARALGLCRPR